MVSHSSIASGKSRKSGLRDFLTGAFPPASQWSRPTEPAATSTSPPATGEPEPAAPGRS